MRRILLPLLLLALVVMMPILPLTEAQDGTPPPDLTPPPPDLVITPDAERVALSLPFSDTFDTDAGWEPSGAWLYSSAMSYQGGGWWVDGMVRDQVSTLTYASLIDLSGTLSAQLIFRQRGSLPPSDLIAVDISLDGGETWLMIDRQIGLDSDEWEQHIVDLTDYRGQVVRLRFRVLAGVQIDESEPVGGGYSIDNLTIQYVAIQPEVFIPVDQGPHTLMGLHLIVGARREPVIDLVRRMQAMGRPIGSVKGTTGTEDILNEIAVVSPDTIIVYRSLVTPLGQMDCPNTANNPVAEAGVWMAGLQAQWSRVQADYYELMNECLPPVEWLVPFSIEAMRLANAWGQCLLLFSFPAGNPEPGQFGQLLPVFDYALKNPCRSGRHHGIALHAYAVQPTTLLSESGISLGLRHRLLMAAILQQMPTAIQLPVYITEAGPGDGRTPFRCEDITRDVIQYTAQLEFDPYVRGFHLWNLGPEGTNQTWTDVTPCLPMIGDALMGYYAGR